MKRIYSIAVLFAALIPNGAYAESKEPEIIEAWECFDNVILQGIPILKTGIYAGMKNGIIVLNELTTYYTSFEIKGIQRRWDFGLTKDGNYDYAITINPDGFAQYYDFSKTKIGTNIKPNVLFYCKRYGN